VKYCYTESDRKGTCYHEFQKGKFNGSFWKEDSLLIHEDSLLIHDDNLYILHLADIFHSVVPSYSEYGETEIIKEQWNEIYNRASEIDGEIKIAIDEINCWAKIVFKTEDIFTILGI